MAIRVELFGTLQVSYRQRVITSVNTSRLQSLLAYLVLNGGAAQSREQLAFLLWPESSESQARTNLRQLLHHLRRALPEECSLLSADNRTVQWRREACTVDVVEFDEAMERAATAEKRGDAIAESSALIEAVRLYQDDLVRGLYDEWLLPRREHYKQRMSYALRRLALLLEERGDFAGGIQYAERLVAQDPLRETHHQLLIRLHRDNNDRASALRAYHQCMRVLRRELGVEPSAATREMFEKILKQESAPAAAAVGASSATSAAPWPLVGRKFEWDRLIANWRLAEQGESRVALILGEPGIGKSRLAEELFEWCGRNEGTAVRARCYAVQGQLAYAPIAECLRAEPMREACSQMAQAQLTELVRVLPEVLADHPAMARPQPLNASWERHYFYESLNAAFARAKKPLLLLIDDLQWCDQDTYEWLHAFLRSDAARRILLAGTVRPEETDRSHPFTRLLSELKQSGHADVLPLSPLDQDQTAEIARRVMQRELEESESAALFRATKGNPLFAVESARAGLQPGTETGGRVHAVIAARFAQLTAPAYELAGLAGTIGQSFSFDLLAKATDWDEASVSRALDELWQRRIVEGMGTSLYDFTHDRLREVAYAELSPVRRRFLHRRVARALEEMHGPELASISGRLAAHYEAAGMAEEAIRHYQVAADVAQRRFANAEAAESLRRALNLCREFPEGPRRDEQELELLVRLGPALAATLGYAGEETGETYARALELSRRLDDKQHRFSVLSGAWVFRVVRSDLGLALELAREFQEQATAAKLPALLMAAHFVLSSSYFSLGKFEAAADHSKRALELEGGETHQAVLLFAGPDIGVFCRAYRAHSLWQVGLMDQSIASADEAVAAAERMAHPFAQAIALNYAAMLRVFRRESAMALKIAEHASAVCARHEFAYYLSMAEVVAGWAMAMEGQVESGLARLRRGIGALKATGAEIRLPFYHCLLAEVCARAGSMGEALANISNGFAFQHKNAEDWAGADLHRMQGDLQLENGNREQAKASYRRAIESGLTTGSRSFALRAAVRLARLGEPAELAGIYPDFHEGAETADLVEARELLGIVREG